MKTTGEITGTRKAETYEHTTGDGSYSIVEGGSLGQYVTDRLVFTDVTADDITLSRDGTKIIFTLANGEKVTLSTQLQRRISQIEVVQFSDGTEWDEATLRTKVFDAMKATGTVTGTNWNDRYEHSLGDGSYTIVEERFWLTGSDRLVFTDVDADDITLSRSGDDVVITLSNGETVTLSNQMANDKTKIEVVEFSDGTEWDEPTLRTKVFDAMKSTGTVAGTRMNDRYEHSLGAARTRSRKKTCGPTRGGRAATGLCSPTSTPTTQRSQGTGTTS